MPQAAVPRPSGQPDPLVALADRCVQCGLCLPSCPTYGHDRVEAESPRGRIALARAWALETIEPTPAGDAHLDHCLGCRSCEAVCPAGVEYGALLTLARSRQRERRGAPVRQRAIEALAARPRFLNALLRLYRRAFPLLPGMVRPLPRPPAASESEGRQPEVPGADESAVFIGCIARTYEAPLRNALVRLATAAGARLSVPPGQSCCGSLHAHAGHLHECDALALVNRKAFAQAKTVLTLASGCHENVASALQGTATTSDAIAWLAARADRLAILPRHERIALHVPCTQRNVVKSAAATRALLARVPGLQVVELTAGFGCCGAAGTNMLLDPERADDYRRPLLEQFAASGASRLLSANIGCRLHFQNATPLSVQHPLEFLAECLDAESNERRADGAAAPSRGHADARGIGQPIK